MAELCSKGSTVRADCGRSLAIPLDVRRPELRQRLLLALHGRGERRGQAHPASKVTASTYNSVSAEDATGQARETGPCPLQVGVSSFRKA